MTPSRRRCTSPGDSPQGVSLYREFQRVDAGDRLRAAANLAVRGGAADPDYRSLWPDGAAIDTVSFDGVGADGLLQVSISDAALRDRPPTMTEREAQLAVQQVVYTLQGVVGARAPVQFLLDGNPVDTVLGVPTAEPLANDPQLEVLSHVNITAPEQGEEASRMLVVTGVASSFEATVPLKVMRGSEVVLEDFATADGWMGKLFPFTKTLDLSDAAARRLHPGRLHRRRRPAAPRATAPSPTPRTSPSPDEVSVLARRGAVLARRSACSCAPRCRFLRAHWCACS